MEKEIKSLTFKDVVNETKKSRFGFSKQLLYFALLTLLSLMLAYVAPFSLIVTIPIVIVPSYFAFTSLNAIKGKRNSENVSFFKMYKTYFSMLFFGGYRLLIGFLKALVTYLASNFVIILIYDLTVFTKSPIFQDFLDKINNTSDVDALNEAFNEFTNLVMSSPDIQKWIYLSAGISMVLGAIMFIHHLFKHSVKIKRNLFVPNAIPARQFNAVEKMVRKENRKFIWGSYVRTSWFIQLAIVLAAAGGIVGSFFLLKEFEPAQALVISLFLMFIVMLPLFNYISKLQEMMFAMLLPTYESTFATMALEFITKYKDKIGIADDDVKKIEDLLNASKGEKKIEDKDKEDNNLEEK